METNGNAQDGAITLPIESTSLSNTVATTAVTSRGATLSAQTNHGVGPNPEASPGELLKAFKRATEEFDLCPNRVWAVAREDLPKLILNGSLIPGHESSKKRKAHENHELCTFDFCEYSQRDFTAVEQLHECRKHNCELLLFSRDTLKQAANIGKSTVWSADGNSMIESHQPYMAISHVWSDGTGTGAWRDGEVNKCLYTFFQAIAKQFQCEGIWWDTLCIPREKTARNKAIRKIQSHYQDARITLVHDCFLRNWEWVDAEAACFVILMSPWFSRGWTALELAKSRKVKVLFKGPCGPLIKDLDEDILARDNDASAAHQMASDIFRHLRKGVTTLNGLLTVLGPRYTSWPKDRAIISGLLVGIELVPKHREKDIMEKDIWQQDIYKRILRKIGKVSPGHLFHNSATMSTVSWCPTSLFNMPMTNSEASLVVTEYLDIVGKWRCIPVTSVPEERYIWNGIHPLVKAQLTIQQKYPDGCVLLAEYGTTPVCRALLVKVMEEKGISTTPCYQYVGAVYFHPALTKDNIGEDANNWLEMEVVLAAGHGPNREAVEYAELSQEPGLHRTPLHDAVWRGDYSKFSELIETPDLYVRDKLGQLPIHLAAERGDQKMLSSLLAKARKDSKEYIIGAQCEIGQTALHRAAWGGSEAVVKLLLEMHIKADTKDRDGNIALHIAAEKGFETVVRRLIHERDLNVKGEKDLTPLHWAARSRHEGVAKLLVDNGADMEAKDINGQTPLHIAAESGFKRVVELLVRKGANIEAKDINRQTPLHIAAANGLKRVVELLVKKGASIEAKDKNVLTPLHLAAKNGHEGVVKLLVEKDASIEARGSNDLTPLHLAAENGHERVVELLVEKGASFEAKNGHGQTPHRVARNRPKRILVKNGVVEARGTSGRTSLHLAAAKGQQRVVELLVEKGADFEATDRNGWTPLWCAAENGLEGIVELLVEKGADIEAKDRNGQTPLWWAAEKGLERVVELLVEKGANVEAKDKDDRTPLHLAMERVHDVVIKLLVNQNANVQAKDKDGRTPLHWAARNGLEEVVELLVEKGADIEAKDKDDRTPLHWAARNQPKRVVNLLVKKGVVDANDLNVRTLLWWKVDSGLEGAVELLAKKGASIEAKDSNDLTPLHWAAESGLEGVAELLVIRRADVKATDKKGRTPLHLAAENGHEGAVRLLMRGADIKAKDTNDRTSLHLAAAKGHQRVVELLVEKGADVEATDRNGRTPLWWATENGHKEIVELLIKESGNTEAKNRGSWTLLRWAAGNWLK